MKHFSECGFSSIVDMKVIPVISKAKDPEEIAKKIFELVRWGRRKKKY